MAITHSFKNDTDYTEGGDWFDDYGHKICEWKWDATSKTLEVNCGLNGSKYDLSEFGNHNFTEEKLKERLPALAIETAERIRDTKYDL